MGGFNFAFYSYNGYFSWIAYAMYKLMYGIIPGSFLKKLYSGFFSRAFQTQSFQTINPGVKTLIVTGDSFSQYLYNTQNYELLAQHMYETNSQNQGVFGFNFYRTSFWGNDSINDKLDNLMTTIQTDETDAAYLVLGSSNTDSLTGTDLNDIIIGGAGSDTLTGNGGDDIFFVDNTHDRVIERTNGGTDTVKSFISHKLDSNVENLTLLGSNSTDAKGNELNNIIEGNSANNIIKGESGDDQLSGNAGNDSLYGSEGDDIINGGTGNDQLYGEADNDYLYGAEGADQLSGGDGNDYIEAGSGNDTVNGGSGNNYILAGTGNDTLTDLSGSDLYTFSQGDGIDVITDLDSTLEDIDTVDFSEGIGKEDIAVFMDNNDLVIGYGPDDQIIVKNQAEEVYGVEMLQLANEDFITAEDINMIVQEMTAFADTEGFAITSVGQVQANPDLMNIVMNGWS